MKMIYVSGKYTGTPEQIVQHVKIAEDAAIPLMNLRWAVLTPHKNTAFYEKYELEFPNLNYDWYIEMDLEMLERCDAILMLRNWKDSKGAIIEKNHAEKLGIPVFFEENGYPSPDAVVQRFPNKLI